MARHNVSLKCHFINCYPLLITVPICHNTFINGSLNWSVSASSPQRWDSRGLCQVVRWQGQLGYLSGSHTHSLTHFKHNPTLRMRALLTSSTEIGRITRLEEKGKDNVRISVIQRHWEHLTPAVRKQSQSIAICKTPLSTALGLRARCLIRLWEEAPERRGEIQQLGNQAALWDRWAEVFAKGKPRC